MTVQIYQGHSHQLSCADVNVVIDVIRAFTFAHYAFLKGAKEIFLAETVHSARQLKEKTPQYMLAGEEKGLHIPGFDLDNSPAGLLEANVEGQILVQKTTNGVRAALHALNASHVFVTGFSNAKTTAQHIRQLAGPHADINIIASHPSGDEDLACAQYMKAIIEGQAGCFRDDTISRIRAAEPAQKFFDADRPEFNPADIDLCVKELDTGFVMKISEKNNLPRIVRVNV
ncbi:2-phosphosulfolactate phosphatase [Domibacillus robiginosus]|uniref:2-phosphosulfolactate phosphatase n=1 Tax=Domibacillus robiginosus TaxID=1071054 RepID=UPI00067A9E95|nr:2-phosphosulfolactate phosphatase [Domibacillus robiginosus]